MQPFLNALFVKWGQGVKGRLIFFPKIHPFWYTDSSLSKHFRRSSNQKTKINGNIVGIQAVAVNNEKPENVNKQPLKDTNPRLVFASRGKWSVADVPRPSIPSLPLSFSLILPSQSPPLTAVSRLLPPTRKASAPLPKWRWTLFQPQQYPLWLSFCMLCLDFE